MIRFYFDLTNREDLSRDDVGVNASGPAEAIEEARVALVEMCRNEEAPDQEEGWQLHIRDGSGTTLGAISFDSGAFHKPDTADRLTALRPSYQ